MKIIAKTKDTFLIEATNDELKEIIRSVIGEEPKSIEIGQKIPAIDYASTITKIKSLNDDYSFKDLLKESERFMKEVERLKSAVDSAGNIEL